jgi:hypothetical protein
VCRRPDTTILAAAIVRRGIAAVEPDVFAGGTAGAVALAGIATMALVALLTPAVFLAVTSHARPRPASVPCTK